MFFLRNGNILFYKFKFILVLRVIFVVFFGLGFSFNNLLRVYLFVIIILENFIFFCKIVVKSFLFVWYGILLILL